jgi:PDZ domain-containing protein
MAQSQSFAAAVALKRAGYPVAIKLPRIVVDQVERNVPATKLLKPGDTIAAVDGQPVASLGRLHELIAAHRPGETLRLRIRRDGLTRTVAVKTIPDPHDKTQAVVGIIVAERGGSVGKLPLKVKIDTAGVGGPSAGLAFALDLMEELGHDVDRGYKIAATGQLELDGTVDPIGGVKQKTIGARQAHVDLFLVPAIDNAAEARKYADGLRIVPVKSFPQALRFLATLPPKH